MTPKLEDTIYIDFVTSSPTTGAATDADSGPTAEVFEDATDTAILSPTVTKRTSKTGNYRIPVACTAANGFEAGKSYNVVASATVGTVAAKAVVGSFQVRAYSADDALRPTTAGRTLDVAATGEAGLDFDNVKQATGATTLTNITVPVVTLVTTTTTLTNKTGFGLSSTQTFDLTGNITGNLSGSVGSVTAGVGLSALETPILQSGTAQAGAASTITLASGASATDNLYVGCVVRIYGGTGAGQARTITGYVGSTKVATVDRAWATNPTSSSTYAVTSMVSAALSSTLAVTAGTVSDKTGYTVSTVSDKTGYSLSSTQTFSMTGNITGNLSGSVGSVTGAAGSVTGNVGGSVASVTVVNGLAAGVITATSIASNAITSAKIATDAIGDAQLATDAVTAIQSGLATSSALTTVDGVADSILAIVDHTDYGNAKLVRSTTPANALTVEADGSIEATLATGQTVGLEGGPGRAGGAMVLGTVLASPSPTTTTCSASVDVVPTVADQFKGRIVIFASDTTTTALRGQATDITASTAPGSGNAGLTFTALTTAPATGDTFVIL